jgi:hypothetical protein
MGESAFEQFVELFKAEGRNLNAVNKDGKTMAEIIRGHAQGEDYLAALTQ